MADEKPMANIISATLNADITPEKPKASVTPATAKTVATSAIPKATAIPGTISYEDFKKLDLRVALIEAAERVEGTAKLVKLSLRVGTEKRQIVAGIADQYAPDALAGKKLIMVYNLQPRMVKGIESQGMLLAAVEPGGKLAFITPERDIADGAQVQ